MHLLGIDSRLSGRAASVFTPPPHHFSIVLYLLYQDWGLYLNFGACWSFFFFFSGVGEWGLAGY